MYEEQCPYEKSVLAKKLNFFAQFFDKHGQLSKATGPESQRYWQSHQDTIVNLEICEHLTRKQRAKFMCHSCYHSQGNSRLATKCGHTNKPHHSRGLCKNCYHKSYYSKKIKVQGKGGSGELSEDEEA